jgi:hypothetical protein
MRRLRRGPKAPLAVAGILATPLFFVALMAFSLLLDKPSGVTNKSGATVLGEPLRSTVATIYALSFGVSLCVVLVGVLALLLATRVGIVVSSLTAIVLTIALLLPLDGWEADHTARYPLGTDLIPKSDPGDLMLRGEWEENARRTAQEIGLWTIALAGAAIAVTIALEIRRRRGLRTPPVPPPPHGVSTPS